jgi:hypothetical protein
MHDTGCGCWNGHAPFLSIEECYENFGEFISMNGGTNEVHVVSYTLGHAPCIFVHTRLSSLVFQFPQLL